MYDLEPWKRPTGLQENVVPTPPRVDTSEAPSAPSRDTDRVSLDIHRLDAEYHRLVVDPAFAPPGAWQYNPSIVVHDGRLVASVRLYLEGARRENVIGDVSDSWELTHQRLLRSEALDPTFKWLPGYEDLRLISRGGRAQAISAVCARTQDGRFRAVAAMLDLNRDLTKIEAAHYQESRFAEKNWMPLVDGDVLRFVYQCEPQTIVLRYDDRERRVSGELPGAVGMLRGGSQLLPLPDGRYLACVHENRAPAGHAIGRYVHRFVLFDRFLQLERKSELFVFRETGIEFCAGMALWRGRLVLSFGLQDKEAWLAVMDLSDALATVGVDRTTDAGIITDACRLASGCIHGHGHTPPSQRADGTIVLSRLVDPINMHGAAEEFGGSDFPEEKAMYDLEPWKAPPKEPLPGRLPDGTPPQAPPAKPSAVHVAPTVLGEHRPAYAGPGPSDEDLFTKTIPGLLGWCSEAKARRLADLVADRNARRVVEIGVFGGRSLLALGVGARRVGGTVIGVDPYTVAASLDGKNARENDAWWSGVDYEDVYRRASAAASLLPGVVVARATSLEAATTFRPGTVDVLHIDGNHSEETSCADVRAWFPKLSLGAIVIMDDVGWGTTRKAQSLLAESGCELLEKYIKDSESWAVYQCIGAKLKSACDCTEHG